MPEYIERESLLAHIKDLPTWWEDDGGMYGSPMKYPEGNFNPEDVVSSIENAPVADVAPVQHQEWKLRPYAFPEDADFGRRKSLHVGIIVSCSGCRELSPYGHEVYKQTLYAPDDELTTYEWNLEAEKQKALDEFFKKGTLHVFAKYCPNCGAIMDMKSDNFVTV